MSAPAWAAEPGGEHATCSICWHWCEWSRDLRDYIGEGSCNRYPERVDREAKAPACGEYTQRPPSVAARPLG